MIFTAPLISSNQFIYSDKAKQVEIFIKREDLLHPHISGNKFRKLKYNLQEARKQKKKKILTFGGAFSNHISATAAAGMEFGFSTVGVIRGEELGKDLKKTLSENPTLQFAASCGMELFFISRERYRELSRDFQNPKMILEELQEKFGDFYLLPEGGTNKLAIKGCEEILSQKDQSFDYICCPVGTGGTMSGIINASSNHQKVLGFSALKGDFLKEEIQKNTSHKNWEIIPDFHFGGYAKVNKNLINFLNTFKKEYGVSLDPIYTGKMMFGIFDLLEKGYFGKHSDILAIHTGGLQGIAGMNRKLQQKALPLIEV